MSQANSLGDRMKLYESAQQIYLTRRTPVIIRIDGKSFHTFCRHMDKPFDEKFINWMQITTKKLVEEISGVTFGYTQSDEISLLLTDYKTIYTEPWFDYRRDKLVSVSASMATAFFNEIINFNTGKPNHPDLAFFDSRAFNIPKEEVVNYFIFRQQDSTRNSIQMLGQSLYSHKELNGKSCDEIQEMTFQKGINWNDLEVYKKRGTAVYKKIIKEKQIGNKGLAWAGSFVNDNDIVTIIRTEIFIDKDIPIFTQDRNFIQRFVDIEENI